MAVVTPDSVGERMAGPGIRARYLASELSRHVPTTLIARLESPFEGAIEKGSPEAAQAIRDAAVLIGQPGRGFRKTRRGQRIIFDLFDPVVVELAQLYGEAPSIRQRVHVAAEWMRLLHALRSGDALMCATGAQERFYRRIQSTDRPWLTVPFGVDPSETQSCPKPQDNVVVWNGGVWEWLDPATAIDAVVRLNSSGLRCRLLFLGRARPNAHQVDRRREERFTALLEGGAGVVSANDRWIPYAERLSWLRAGKIAIMLHRPTPEAALSIRTRFFDAVAASVPIVATEEGYAAEMVAREGLGLVVPASNVDAVASAIRRLLTDDGFHSACVSNLRRIQPQLAWEVAVRPLVDIVTQWQTEAPHP